MMSAIPGNYKTARHASIHAPTGTALSCKGWHQEAALRMLMNNLDPEVAERPDDLVVYGGSGKAARDWRCFDAIVETLRGLVALVIGVRLVQSQIVAACCEVDILLLRAVFHFEAEQPGVEGLAGGKIAYEKGDVTHAVALIGSFHSSTIS